MNDVTTQVKLIRFLVRYLGYIFTRILARTTIIGLENIPSDGPLIFAGNHASTFDALMALIYLPSDVQLVGPGDFRFKWPARLAVEQTGIILAKRGSADRESLTQMTQVLKSGGKLALFPEGGTWEKRLDDVKPGAAYLSHTCNAPIIPIAIGGTYQVWYKILKLRRPKVNMIFLPPLPPVEIPNRKERQAKLQEASLELMQHIYDHLPPDEQARYNLHARQIFRGILETAPDTLNRDSLPDFGVLAELISKPNLFHPLKEHAKREMKVFRKPHQFTSAIRFQVAVDTLYDALKNHFPDYLDYRLGSQKARKGMEELEILRQMAAQAVELDVALRFVPSVTIADHPLPANI